MSSHDKNFTLTLFTLGFCHVIHYQGDKKVSLPREDRVRKKRKERVEAGKYVENTVCSFKKFENNFFERENNPCPQKVVYALQVPLNFGTTKQLCIGNVHANRFV